MARPHLLETAQVRAEAIRHVAKILAGYTGTALANPNINPDARHYQAAFVQLYRPGPAEIYDERLSAFESWAGTALEMERSWQISHDRNELELEPIFFGRSFRLFEGATIQNGCIVVPKRTLLVPGEGEVEIAVGISYPGKYSQELAHLRVCIDTAEPKCICPKIMFRNRWSGAPPPLFEELPIEILVNKEYFWSLIHQEDWIISQGGGGCYSRFVNAGDPNRLIFEDPGSALPLILPFDLIFLMQVFARFPTPTGLKTLEEPDSAAPAEIPPYTKQLRMDIP